MTPDKPTNKDPRPAEPYEPDLNDCCGNGCEPCVFDTYIEEKRRWEQAMKEWEVRQASRTGHPAQDQTTRQP